MSHPSPITTTLHTLPTGPTLSLTTSSHPPTSPSRPHILLLQGLASETHMWLTLFSLLTPLSTVSTHTRSGYSPSPPVPHAPTAERAAQDLSLLLDTAGITGPWILVAHSWGGIIAREFIGLERRRGEVVGLVLVDANQENTLARLDWRNESLWAVAGEECRGSRRVCEVVLGLPERHRLREEEYAAHVEEVESAAHKAQAAREVEEYPKSFLTLATKPHLLLSAPEPLLGDAPVVVIRGDNARDYMALYEYGVSKGYGTEAERDECRRVLGMWNEVDTDLQREMCKLSRRSRYVQVEGSGHDVQMTAPEVVVREVGWVLGELGFGKRE